jgi:hypothetical protein
MGDASARGLDLMGIADIDDFEREYEVAEEVIRLFREGLGECSTSGGTA